MSINCKKNILNENFHLRVNNKILVKRVFKRKKMFEKKDYLNFLSYIDWQVT